MDTRTVTLAAIARGGSNRVELVVVQHVVVKVLLRVVTLLVVEREFALKRAHDRVHCDLLLLSPLSSDEKAEDWRMVCVVNVKQKMVNANLVYSTPMLNVSNYS